MTDTETTDATDATTETTDATTETTDATTETTDATTETTDATTQGSESDTDPTETTDTEGGNVEYYAFALIGALDRVVIRKADSDTGMCTELRLVYPGQMMWDISVPEQWGVEGASTHDTLEGCFDKDVSLGEAEWAIDGQGAVDWLENMQLYPCVLDVGVSLMFENSVEMLTVAGLPVDGC